VSGPASLRVLVIDDEPAVRDVLKDFLEFFGHRPVCAGDGAEGLARLGEREFDLVLTDVRMPVMDGWEVVRVARERWPSLTTIIVSGSGDLMDQSGCDVELLMKPIGLMELKAAVDRVVTRLGIAGSAA
jgi:CheY-like chemotaxis protein